MPASKCHGSHCCYYTSLVTVECPLTPTEARQPRGLSLHPSYTTQLLCDVSRGTRGRQQPKRLHGAARLSSTGLIRRHSQPEPPDNLLVQLTPLWSPRSSCTTLPDFSQRNASFYTVFFLFFLRKMKGVGIFAQTEWLHVSSCLVCLTRPIHKTQHRKYLQPQKLSRSFSNISN